MAKIAKDSMLARPSIIKEIDGIEVKRLVRYTILPEIIEALKTGIYKTDLRNLLKELKD